MASYKGRLLTDTRYNKIELEDVKAQEADYSQVGLFSVSCGSQDICDWLYFPKIK